MAEPKTPSVESDQKAPEKPENELDELTSLHERTLAALSYVGFFAIVPFYLKKDSKFCRFHGKQGMLIAIIFFFAKLLLVLDLLNDLALVLQFVIFVKMGFAALSGKWTRTPWIYDTACRLEEQLSIKDQETDKKS